MKTFLAMTKRNIKLFFRDKGLFFTSMITPIILLILYATFLANVYRDSFSSSIPPEILETMPKDLVNGTVAAQLFAALLSVCTVTVAFCSNTIMAQDKVCGARKDFTITPVRKSTLALSYYFGTLATTLIVTFLATAVSLLYIATQGWYYTAWDVVRLFLDVLLLTTFGTALSSVVNRFLTTQGQISAVGTMVSAGYGFICGAYMPISQFGKGLQNALSFLPGTYATSLLKNDALSGALAEMGKSIPPEEMERIRRVMDCSPEFFGTRVSVFAMVMIVLVATLLCTGLYLLLFSAKKPHKKAGKSAENSGR